MKDNVIANYVKEMRNQYHLTQIDLSFSSVLEYIFSVVFNGAKPSLMPEGGEMKSYSLHRETMFLNHFWAEVSNLVTYACLYHFNPWF